MAVSITGFFGCFYTNWGVLLKGVMGSFKGFEGDIRQVKS